MHPDQIMTNATPTLPCTTPETREMIERILRDLPKPTPVAPVPSKPRA